MKSTHSGHAPPRPWKLEALFFGAHWLPAWRPRWARFVMTAAGALTHGAEVRLCCRRPTRRAERELDQLVRYGYRVRFFVTAATPPRLTP